MTNRTKNVFAIPTVVASQSSRDLISSLFASSSTNKITTTITDATCKTNDSTLRKITSCSKSSSINKKCVVYQRLLQQAKWLTDQECKSELKDALEVKNGLMSHIQSACDCTPKPLIKLFLACTFMHQYSCMVNHFNDTINEQLAQQFEHQSRERKQKLKQQFAAEVNDDTGDLAAKLEPKFFWSTHDLISVANFRQLIDSALKALKFFTEALNDDKQMCVINDKTLNKTLVLCHLRTLMQIFQYYQMTEHCLKTSNVAMEMLSRYYSSSSNASNNKMLENVKLLHCYTISILLKNGFHHKANQHYKRYFGSYEPPVDTINTFGDSVLFLLSCELALHSQKGKQFGPKLKQFINSDYLKENTPKRFLLKIMALVLCTKFPSKLYEFDCKWSEFFSPIQMAMCICQRWNMNFALLGNTKARSMTNSNSGDNVWFRYSILNVLAESVQTGIHFYINTGIFADACYYYKVICYIHSVFLNIIGLAEMKLLAAKLLLKNDSFDDSCSMLKDFVSLFVPKQAANIEIDEAKKDSTTSSIDDANKTVDQNVMLVDTGLDNIDDVHDIDSEQAPDVMVVYRRLMKLQRSKLIYENETNQIEYNNDDDNNETIDIGLMVTQRFNSIQKEGIHCYSVQLFYFSIHAVAIELMLKHYNVGNSFHFTTPHYNQLLAILEHYTTGCVIPQLEKAFGGKVVGGGTKIMEEQLYHAQHISTQFWWLTDFYLQTMIKAKSYREAMCVLESVGKYSTYSLEGRYYRTRAFYYRALLIYKLIKHKHINNSARRLVKLNCDQLLEEESSPSEESKTKTICTPSPPQRRTRRQLQLQAPKPKKFGSTPERDYGAALLKQATKTKGNKKSSIFSHFLEDTRRTDAGQSWDTTATAAAAVTNQNLTSKSSTTISLDLGLTRSAKKKPQTETFNIYIGPEEQQQQQDSSSSSSSTDSSNIDQEFLSHFDRALSLSVNSSTNNPASYFAEQFNLNTFDLDTSVATLDILEVIKLLWKINDYIGLHPPYQLYRDCQYLLYKYARLKGRSPLVQMYHLSETIDYIPYRYRNVICSHRKLITNTTMNESVAESVGGNGGGGASHANTSYIDFNYDDFDSKFVDCIKLFPKNWRFFQINLRAKGNNFPDLLFSNFHANRSPAFLRVRSKHQTKIIKCFMEEFNEVMEGNNASILEKDKVSFWELRNKFDRQLKLLLQEFEHNFFGPFKAFMLGAVTDSTYQTARYFFKRKLLELAKSYSLEFIDEPLLNIFIESIVLLSETEFITGLRILFETTNTNKPEFISRVIQYKKKYFKTWTTHEEKVALFANASPVCLIIDHSLAQFPFESLPTARKLHQPFFRVPSLRIAYHLYHCFATSSNGNVSNNSLLEHGITDHNTSYLLNPANNLTKTEDYFRSELEKIKEWHGVIGQEPKPDVLKSFLEQSDLYLYFGHGSGNLYYSRMPHGLDNLQLKPASIVVGCSSGRIMSDGPLSGAFGMPYRFLINGAPCYLGNLWDVTDRDIDTFSDHFMTLWLPRWKPIFPKQCSLPKSLAMSRDVCKLKHLIGCAPVVYGVPLHTITVHAKR